MKTFIRGLGLLCAGFGMMLIGMLMFFITGGDPRTIHIKITPLSIIFWLFFISFSTSAIPLIMSIFKETIWKNQKQVDDLLKKLHEQSKELQRKIDKL